MIRRAGWLICSILASSCGGRVADAGDDSAAADTAIDSFFDDPAPPPDARPEPVAPDAFVDARPEVVVEGPTSPIVAVNASAAREVAYFCLGAFLVGDDPAAKDSPIDARGPFGPLRFGEAAPVPLSEPMAAALRSFTVVVWVTGALGGTTCRDTWRSTRTDRTLWRAIPKGTINPDTEGVVFGATDAPAPEVTFAVLPKRPPEGVDAVQSVHWAGGPPADLSFQPRGLGFHRLALFSTYGTISGLAPVPPFTEARFIIAKPGTMPCVTSDGAPSSTCAAWSPELSSFATKLGAGPTHTIIWFGSPAIATGPGSLRAIWLRR